MPPVVPMRLSRLALLSPLLLLVACGGNPQTAGGPQVSGRFSGTDSSASATKSGEMAALPSDLSEPARLKGLTTTQVKSVLGRPGFTRRDAPAEIWQYRGRVCTLDLFLYEDDGRQVVAHYAMRGTQPLDERGCFDELTGRGRTAPMS